jgi:hypothetical protein
MKNLTLRDVYTKFNNNKNKFFTIEQMLSLQNNKSTQSEHEPIMKSITNMKYTSQYQQQQQQQQQQQFKNYDTKRQSRSKKKKVYETKEMRVITSLHIEKDKSLLSRAIIPGPWTVGLIINLARDFDRKGNKLKKQRKVKCLTVLYLAGNMSLDETEEYFNNENKVSLSTLKPYCGFLSISFAITGWDTLNRAKQGLMCWKTQTRGKFSRQKCGGCVFDIFKRDCTSLQYATPKFRPDVIIKRHNKQQF